MLKKLLLSASFVFMALTATAMEVVTLYEGAQNLNDGGSVNISRNKLITLATGTVTIDYTLNEGVTEAKLRLSTRWGYKLLPGFDETGFMHVTKSGSYNYTLTEEVIKKLDDKDFHGYDPNVTVSGEGMTVTKVYCTLNDTEQLISTPVNLDNLGKDSWNGLRFSKAFITNAKAGWKIFMYYTVNDGAKNAFFRWATSYANIQLPGFEGTSQLDDKDDKSVIPVTNDGSYTYIITEDAVAKLNDHNVTGWDKEIHIVGSGITVTKLELIRGVATETVSVSNAGYATHATTNNVKVPNDVEVMTVTVNDDNSTITLNEVEAGTVIPAKTGILVKAAKGNYNFVVTSKEGTTFENNNLIAATTEVTSDGAKYFALTKIGDKVGFAKVAKDVKIPAGKAYLMVENGTPAKFFGLDGEATGINSVKTAKADGAYYTLEGVKTTKPVKGLYIHNGKKIVVK